MLVEMSATTPVFSRGKLRSGCRINCVHWTEAISKDMKWTSPVKKNFHFTWELP